MGPDDDKVELYTSDLGEDPEFLSRGDVPDEPPCPRERFVFDKVHSSGEKDELASGAVRDKRAGKGRYDLISPIATRRLARQHEKGMSSGGYAPRNWEKGEPLHFYLDSAKRHIDRYIEDRIRGREPEEDSVAAAVWNLNCFMHTEELVAAGELPPELDDILTEKLPEQPDFEEAVHIDEEGNICKSGKPETVDTIAERTSPESVPHPMRGVPPESILAGMRSAIHFKAGGPDGPEPPRCACVREDAGNARPSGKDRSLE